MFLSAISEIFQKNIMVLQALRAENENKKKSLKKHSANKQAMDCETC